MTVNPRLCRGEGHSPAAFFRGIVRGVLADRQTPAATVCREGSPRPNLLPSTASQPDEGLAERAASRMALRARRLFADGADHAVVSRQLKAEHDPGPSAHLPGSQERLGAYPGLRKAGSRSWFHCSGHHQEAGFLVNRSSA